MQRNHYTGIDGSAAKFYSLSAEAHFQKPGSGVDWKLSLLSRAGRKGKTGEEKNLLGCQKSP